MSKFLLAFRGAAAAVLLCASPGAFAQPGPEPDGPFMLHNGRQCLGINDEQLRTDGARVQLSECLGRRGQVWRSENGRIVSVATGRCLDVHGPDVGINGARVQVSSCHGGANQAWQLDRGQLVVQADGRCLESDGDEAQTWDCRSGSRQQWSIELLDAPAVTREVEAGPIWNKADAAQKCPATCGPARWTGAWHTTVQGRMSVCTCAWDARPAAIQPVQPPRHSGPRPMSEERFAALRDAMAAESFTSGRLRVLEDAARDNYFLVEQLRQVVDGLDFPSDRMRVVEILAPRVLDRQNAYTLYSAFTFESEKDQVRALFERLK